MEQLQSHRMTNGLLTGKYLRISSYFRKPFLMTLQQLHSEFPYIQYIYEDNFLFYQCIPSGWLCSTGAVERWKWCGFEWRPEFCMMNYLKGYYYVPHQGTTPELSNKMTTTRRAQSGGAIYSFPKLQVQVVGLLCKQWANDVISWNGKRI